MDHGQYGPCFPRNLFSCPTGSKESAVRPFKPNRFRIHKRGSFRARSSCFGRNRHFIPSLPEFPLAIIDPSQAVDAVHNALAFPEFKVGVVSAQGVDMVLSIKAGLWGFPLLFDGVHGLDLGSEFLPAFPQLGKNGPHEIPVWILTF